MRFDAHHEAPKILVVDHVAESVNSMSMHPFTILPHSLEALSQSDGA